MGTPPGSKNETCVRVVLVRLATIDFGLANSVWHDAIMDIYGSERLIISLETVGGFW